METEVDHRLRKSSKLSEAFLARWLLRVAYLGLLLICFSGCSKNGGFANPFASAGTSRADRTLSGSPAQQVAQLEQWRRESDLEVKQLRQSVSGLTEKNQTLQNQFANAQRQMQLQGQHLKSVSDRLAATTSELAQTQMQKKGTSQNAASLNELNQEKERQLAAARQSVQKLQQQLNESTEQLEATQSQLVQSEARAKSAQQSVEHLTASSRQRGGATIRPNQNLKLINLSADEGTIERDGSVIRIQMSAESVFNPQTAQIREGKISTLNGLGKKLAAAYPNQRIGLEGHASSNQSTQGAWRNGHHLSSAQAMAIYEFFLTRSIFQSDQMFIVGHGANHPVFSSATETGRLGNDRVEIVIYPDAVR
ncbi:MAG: OmpA family protein [Planctomycetota bacterium]|nr:OmpA family protein [Planctomycetota bacterium]